MRQRDPLMIKAILREAIAAARSQAVSSLVTILMVAGMIIAVMLTTGRTVGAEREVLASIDSAGSRAITIRAEPSAGLTTSFLDRISGIEGIEWAGGLSTTYDATNAEILDGARVPLRYLYTTDLSSIGVQESLASGERAAWGSPRTLEILGVPAGGGAVRTVGGLSYAIGGSVELPQYLRELEPMVIVPGVDRSEPLTTVTIVVRTPTLVGTVSSAIVPLMDVDDPSKVTVTTSEALVELRSLIQGQLSSFSRGLVLVLLLVTGSLVAILLFGLVMMRRKDFGRRRALGATRTLIVALLLTQTLLLALAGTGLGVLLSISILIATGHPLPGLGFIAALSLLALLAASVAALVPALVASRREPIRELRVP